MHPRPLVQLKSFDNSWYHPGRPFWVRGLWFLVNVAVLQCPLNPGSRLRVWALRLFGARVGAGVVIKPRVNIKYPWKLQIGNDCWIGEGVWIDNLGMVVLEHDVCLSQECLLLCGNHNYKAPSFDLMVGDILVESGSWIGARSVVCPGVTVRSHAVLTAGSVATSDMEAWGVYQGHPARKIRERL